MSTQRNLRGVALRAVPRVAGFTLIELMIAMILGLIVIAGVTSVFLAGQQSFRTNNALADVQDSSRIAFELMARDIRQAGLTGCNSLNSRVTNVLANSPGNAATPAWWADWNNAVHGYDDASTDPALTGLTSGTPVAGTSSLELLSAGDAAYTIANDVPGTGFKINTTTYDLSIGDIIIACSPDHAAIMQITGQNITNVQVNYNTGSKVSPGNCSNNLGFPNTNCAGNSPDYTFPPNSKIAKLTAADWYIGVNPVGGKSLYRVSLQNNAGTASAVPQEMVRNVTGMTITYLNPSIGAISAKFVNAATMTADNGWAGVTAVQVQLQVQSTFQRATTGATPTALSRTYAFTTTLRNRVN
ncbi:MAG: prepilin-type N-terminal cleavage/methylation domain-containing protein [Rhodanobacteraceae bacterium]|nr:MAG: prepilin-type N-terminal cleavage/methylation domain-containing protein [Rhodanobacteraceae bacterium]